MQYIDTVVAPTWKRSLPIQSALKEGRNHFHSIMQGNIGCVFTLGMHWKLA